MILAILVNGDVEYHYPDDVDAISLKSFQLVVDTAIANLPAEKAGTYNTEDREPKGLQFEAKPTFPVDALGEILGGAAAEIAAAVQVPVELAAQSVLGVASFAAQRVTNIRHPVLQTEIPLSLFLLSVAQSGDRKSACDKQAARAVKEHSRALFEVYQQEHQEYLRRKAEGGAELIAPREANLIIREPTLEGLQKSFENGQPSQAIFNDEAGSFFGGHAMKPENAAKTICGLSEFWDGQDIVRTRASDRILLTNRRLAVHLLTQPVIAETLLKDPLLQQQGIFARFLVCHIDSIAGSRFIDRNLPPVPHTARDRLHKEVHRLLNSQWEADFTGGVVLPCMELEPHAVEAWDLLYNESEKEQAPGGAFEIIGPFVSKVAEQALRIATILAVFEDSPAVSVDAMLRATRLANFYLNTTLRLAQEQEAEPLELRAQQFIEWLAMKRGGRATIEEIDKYSPRPLKLRRDRRHIRNVMQIYCESKLLRQVGTDGRGQPNQWEVFDAAT
ncbi:MULTISPECIES: YfjI family protein [Microbulbifer]|nr:MULTISPECIES: YfjI family protein [Microbulbifer]KUJ83422.1 hypothetical protein AVO43_06045 [Microbulbifer sp. ZGT114]